MTQLDDKISKLTDTEEVAILTAARGGLVMAAQHQESGLSDEPHAQVRSRALGVAVGATGQPQVQIDSTKLSLDQKLFVERFLIRHLDAENFPDVTVYFRRSSSAGASISAKPTATPRRSPLGLSINKQAIPGVRHVIAVASGKGGVGKSTVASNLAAGFAKLGFKSGLMDCDVYGPSAQLMMGLSGTVEVKNGRLIPLNSHGVSVVSFGLLADVRSPVIWRGPMVAKAIEQLCYDVNWGDLDVLVLDLPPGTGDVQLTLAERIPISGAVIVTTPQEVALIDAHKAVSMFEKLEVPIFGVVQNMATHSCTNCGHTDQIFGGEEFGAFLQDRRLAELAKIPLARDVRVAADSGKPVVLGSSPLAMVYEKLVKTVMDQLNSIVPQSPARDSVGGQFTKEQSSREETR